MDDVRAIGAHRIFEIARSPYLLALCICVCIAFVSTLKSAKWGAYALGLLIFCSMPAPAVDYWGDWVRPPVPLDKLVMYARTFTFILLVLMLIISAAEALRTRPLFIPSAVKWFLAIQVYLCLRVGVGGYANESATRLVIYLMIFLAMGVVLPTIWRNQQDISKPLKVLALAVTLYTICTAYEMAFFWEMGFRQSRWLGITGSPNHAGMIAAIYLPALLGLMSWVGCSKKTRVTLLVVISVLVLQTLLTGSRGAILTAIVGVLMFYRIRLGKFAIAAIPVAILSMLILNQFNETDANFNRLLSTQNTRGHVLEGGYKVFLANPVFGYVGGGFHFIENSYLAFVMKTGVIGLAILTGAIFAFTKMVYVGLRSRAQAGTNAPLLDAGIAGIVAIGANGMIEATFLANLNQTIFAVYVYAAVLYLATMTSPTPAPANMLYGRPSVSQGFN